MSATRISWFQDLLLPSLSSCWCRKGCVFCAVGPLSAEGGAAVLSGQARARVADAAVAGRRAAAEGSDGARITWRRDVLCSWGSGAFGIGF